MTQHANIPGQETLGEMTLCLRTSTSKTQFTTCEVKRRLGLFNSQSGLLNGGLKIAAQRTNCSPIHGSTRSFRKTNNVLRQLWQCSPVYSQPLPSHRVSKEMDIRSPPNPAIPSVANPMAAVQDHCLSGFDIFITA